MDASADVCQAKPRRREVTAYVVRKELEIAGPQ
jgi:hypothetical protein